MIIVNEGKMKASIAYLNAEELMATLETAADYLAHHNKNMTKKTGLRSGNAEGSCGELGN